MKLTLHTDERQDAETEERTLTQENTCTLTHTVAYTEITRSYFQIFIYTEYRSHLLTLMHAYGLCLLGWKADVWAISLLLNIHEHLLSTKHLWDHHYYHKYIHVSLSYSLYFSVRLFASFVEKLRRSLKHNRKNYKNISAKIRVFSSFVSYSCAKCGESEIIRIFSFLPENLMWCWYALKVRVGEGKIFSANTNTH